MPAHPDFSYLKSTSEKEDILFVVHGKDDDDVAFPVHLVKLSSLEEGNVLRVLSDTSDRSSEGIYRVELPHVVTASGFHAVLRCDFHEVLSRGGGSSKAYPWAGLGNFADGDGADEKKLPKLET